MPRTAEQNANLDKLATYLENLPEDYQHFNMSWWIIDRTDDQEKYVNYCKNNGGVASCGTAACAAGHGPAAGILFKDNDFTEDWEDKPLPSWSNYTRNNFALDNENVFIFSGGWVTIDNHHYGAAARIRWLLDHEDVLNTDEVDDYPTVYASRKWLPIYRKYDKRYATEKA